MRSPTQRSCSPSRSLPTTWQHGDLHPWNVFAPADAGLRIFDFGDGQWSHAVEVLSVPYGWIEARTELAWGDLVDAYADAWGLTVDELDGPVGTRRR